MSEQLFYIIYNGQQVGPLPARELVAYGLNANSQVWTDGMPAWVAASTVPALAPYLPVVPPTMPGTPYAAPGVPLTPEPYQPVPDRTGLAIAAIILGFIFSCIGCICGIVALIKAGESKSLVTQGFYTRAAAKADTAKNWCIATFVLSALGFLGLGASIIGGYSFLD